MSEKMDLKRKLREITRSPDPVQDYADSREVPMKLTPRAVTDREEVALRHLLATAERESGFDYSSPGGKVIARHRQRYLDYLGGVERLSPQQLALVDLIARQTYILDTVDSYLASRTSLLTRGSRLPNSTVPYEPHVLPIVGERARLAESLIYHLKTLGLTRADVHPERAAAPAPANLYGAIIDKLFAEPSGAITVESTVVDDALQVEDVLAGKRPR